MPTVAGIDLSTQSCTVEVRDADSFEVVARSRVPLPPTTPPVSEQNAAAWWEALVWAFGELSQQVELYDIVAIGVSGQCHGLVPLDAENRPIRPAKLWNDTTSSSQISGLIARWGADFWAQRIGSVPTAAFTIGKLAWLIENEPETISALRHILLPHDYAIFRLTGEYVTDRSEASGTGYFNSQTNEYDYDLLESCFGGILPWREILPRVGGPDDVAGTVTTATASELGLTPGIPVTVGGGDQHIAALGLGIEEGDVVVSIGTSGVVYTSSSRAVTSGKADGVANVTGGWLPLVCTLNSTKVTDWMAALLGVNVKELDALAWTALERNAQAPVFAAYLDGERSPAYPGVTGVIAGLTSSVSREEFALSAFYGVALGLVRGLEAIRDSGVEVGGRVIAVGGGARSEVYTQVLADLLGRPVEVINEPEATARGACVQAIAAVTREGVVSAGSRLRPLTARVTHPRSEATWRDLRENYLGVCDYAASTAHLRG